MPVQAQPPREFLMPLKLVRRQGSDAFYVRGTVRGIRCFEFSAHLTRRAPKRTGQSARRNYMKNPSMENERSSHFSAQP